jgi:cytoskeletal protein CcmA (bactofilin family)
VDSYQDYSTALTQLSSGAAVAASGLNVQSDGNGGLRFSSGGAGDVVGPSSSTKYGIPTFSDTTGKILENSPVTITSAGNMSGLNTVSANTLYCNGDLYVSGHSYSHVLQATGTNGVTINNSVGSAVASFGTANTENVTFNGAVNFVGKVSGSAAAFTGPVSAQSIFANGDVSVSGNVSARSIFSNGDLTVSGNSTFRNITATGNVTASAAAFSGVVSANNGLGVSGNADFKNTVNVSGQLKGGLFAYRSFTTLTTASIGDSGVTLVCNASATTTVQLRGQDENLPVGYNVRIRMRRSGIVYVTCQTNDSMVGGNKIATQNRDALFEVESVSGSAHSWFGTGTLT